MSLFKCLLPGVLLVVTATQSIAQTDSLPLQAEAYFAGMRERFDKTASSKYATGTKRSVLNQHFVYVMTKYPTMHSFIKTNSKGKLINKVSFGKVPGSVVEDIPDDTWYSHIKKSRKARDKVWFDKESGRYYLVWSKPVVKGANEAFVGMIAVKIDIWDTFHKFSKTTDVEFLAYINGKPLYSHDWKRPKVYTVGSFAVPGLKSAAMRYVKAGSAADMVEPVVGKTTEAGGEDAGTDEEFEEQEEKAGGHGVRNFFIVLLILAVVGGGAYGYLRYKKKQDDLLRSIDQAPSTVAPQVRPLDEIIDSIPDEGVDNRPDTGSSGERDRPVV